MHSSTPNLPPPPSPSSSGFRIISTSSVDPGAAELDTGPKGHHAAWTLYQISTTKFDPATHEDISSHSGDPVKPCHRAPSCNLQSDLDSPPLPDHRYQPERSHLSQQAPLPLETHHPTTPAVAAPRTAAADNNGGSERRPRQRPELIPTILPEMIGDCSTPFSKRLSMSDVKSDQARLALKVSNYEKFLMRVLRQEEKDALKEEGIPVVVYDVGGGKQYDMRFKHWERMAVVTFGWMDFVNDQRLLDRVHGNGVDIAVWMFRRNDDEKGLFFALALRDSPQQRRLWRDKGTGIKSCSAKL